MNNALNSPPRKQTRVKFLGQLRSLVKLPFFAKHPQFYAAVDSRYRKERTNAHKVPPRQRRQVQRKKYYSELAVHAYPPSVFAHRARGCFPLPTPPSTARTVHRHTCFSSREAEERDLARGHANAFVNNPSPHSGGPALVPLNNVGLPVRLRRQPRVRGR